MQDFLVILTCSVLCSSAPRMLWRLSEGLIVGPLVLSQPFLFRSPAGVSPSFPLCFISVPDASLSPPSCVFSPPLTIRAIAARGSNMMARKNSASFCIRTELGSYSVSIAWQSSHGASVQKAILRSRNHCEDVCIVTRLRFHF